MFHAELLGYVISIAIILSTILIIYISNIHNGRKGLNSFSIFHISALLFVLNMFMQQLGKHLLIDDTILIYRVVRRICKYGSLTLLHFSYFYPLLKPYLTKKRTTFLLSTTWLFLCYITILDDFFGMEELGAIYYKLYFFGYFLMTIPYFFNYRWKKVIEWVEFPFVYPLATLLFLTVSIQNISYELEYHTLDIVLRVIQISALVIASNSIIILSLKRLFGRGETKVSKVNLALKNLTPREKQIAEYILQGKTYKEVADLLSISVRTVNTHVTNIFKKTNVSNKIELSKLL